MTTYIFLSNFLCAALIPICFPLIEPGNGMGFMASFLLILYKVCAILVVPMLLAYITKHFKPLHRFYEWLIGVRLELLSLGMFAHYRHWHNDEEHCAC